LGSIFGFGIFVACVLGGMAPTTASAQVEPGLSPANGVQLPAKVLHVMSDLDLDRSRTFWGGELWTVRGWFESRGMQVDGMDRFAGGLTLQDLQAYDAVIVCPVHLGLYGLYGHQGVFEDYVTQGGGLIILGQGGTDPAVTLDQQFGFWWRCGWYLQATMTDSDHPVLVNIDALPRAGGAFLDWDDYAELSPLPAGAEILATTHHNPYYYYCPGVPAGEKVALMAFEHGAGGVVVGPWDGMVRPWGPTSINYMDVEAYPEDAIENLLLLNSLAWVARLGDLDQDGIEDAVDNCPVNANSGQLDIDNDGRGDVCDNCPDHFNPQQEDAEDDGWGDVCDTCPQVAHPSNLDSDADGVGDACDCCPDTYNPDQVDGDISSMTYDFEYALDRFGDLGGPAEPLANFSLLGPDKEVTFETLGAAGVTIDGEGFLRLDRWGWGEDDRLALIMKDPLPDEYEISIKDLYRTLRSGYYMTLSIVSSPDGSLPTIREDIYPVVPPDRTKMAIVPNGYWAKDGRFVCTVTYTDTARRFWMWNEHANQWILPPPGFELEVLPYGFGDDTDLLYEIIKDASGYRARITRLDTSPPAVILETTPVPTAQVIGWDQPDYSIVGTHRNWIGTAYTNLLDDWVVVKDDGVGDACDNCPLDWNMDQSDVDGDYLGDVCDPCPSDPGNDDDEDGACFADDNCPYDPNPGQEDIDLDGTGDVCDNCPDDSNLDQLDVDGDTLGDVCDPCPLDPDNDADGDGLCGDVDACPAENPDGVDADGDGCIDRISDFASLVLSLDLPVDREQALLDSIYAAEAAIARGNFRAARNQLNALINKIEAGRGKGIPEDVADMLILYAENVIDSIS
jgi:hypothetical protein